jgi:CRP-like cAMP-binding protein
MKISELSPVRPGERTNPSGRPVRNLILLSLSDAEYRKIRPHLEFVELPSRASLHEPLARAKFAYFVNAGLASVMVAMRGGKDVEAGVVGKEGMVGTMLAVGLQTSPLRVVMQIEGAAFRISAPALETVLHAMPDLKTRLGRYAVLQGMQVAQTAACNRLHRVSRRLARWLLMAQDRTDSATLPLTHDFLATMLGTDRPSVTLAARALQGKKAIRCRRASVAVLDRKRLESLSCECYRAVQQLNGHLGLK